jgi:hypothetical protein
VAGLETLELQLRAMASVPEADQMDILKAALRTYDRIDDILETTVQLYLARQIGIIWPLQLALAERRREVERAPRGAHYEIPDALRVKLGAASGRAGQALSSRSAPCTYRGGMASSPAAQRPATQ